MTRIDAGKSYETFNVRFNRFPGFWFVVAFRFIFYPELESQIPFHRVVVDIVTSDLYKSAWEDVPGKSAQELNTTESDVLFSRSLSVIPGNEGHFFIRDIHDTCPVSAKSGGSRDKNDK